MTISLTDRRTGMRARRPEDVATHCKDCGLSKGDSGFGEMCDCDYSSDGNHHMVPTLEEEPKIPLDDLLEFAEAWASLGPVVQRQVKAALDDPEYEANINAIEMAFERLGPLNHEIHAGLSVWLCAHGVEGCEDVD